MRREGVAFASRTNHTLRVTPCLYGHSGEHHCCCHNHPTEEQAYRSLAASNPDKGRFSRKELYDEVVRLGKAEGAMRSRVQACVLGSSARKSLKSRYWSGCRKDDYRESKHERRESLRTEIETQLRLCM